MGNTVRERNVRKDNHMQSITSKPYQLDASIRLAVAPVALGIVELPSMAAASLGVVVAVTLVNTTGLLASCGETTALTVL